MLQELSDESRRMDLKINIAKTKVMVVDNPPINVNNVLIENVEGYVYLGEPGSLQKQPCHLPEDTCVQLLSAVSCAIYADSTLIKRPHRPKSKDVC